MLDTTRLVVTTTVAATLTAGLIAAPIAASGATAGTATVPTATSRADVDGDGRPDSTTITPLRGGSSLRVTTRTAEGRASSITLQTPNLFGDASPLYATARLDGAAGSELIVRTGLGAHTQYFAVLTWRNGALVREKDPSGSAEWITDGAWSVGMGYTAGASRGVRQMTQIVLTRDDATTFSGRRVVAAWKHGRWTPVTDRALVRKDGPNALSGAGWNVAGVPQF